MYVPRKGSQLELRTGIVTCMYTHNNHRESRERRDKIFAEKTENANKTKLIRNSSFQWGIFIFLAAGKLTFGGVGYDFKIG